MHEICAIFKNEARYLREWIEFHRIQGFDHFQLYDNGSSDDDETVLAPYVDAGVVSVTPWTGPRSQGQSHQIEAYRDCLARAKPGTWTAFIDIDEFLYSGTTERFVDALQQYEEYPGVVIPWRVFGSAGLTSDDGGLVIERFTRRAAGSHCLVKSVIQVSRGFAITAEGGVHTFLPLRPEGGVAVSEAGQEVPIGKRIPGLPSHVLRCNHYPVKSYEEFSRKVQRGREYLDGQFDMSPAEYLGQFDKNDVEDRDICRFLPQLKSALGVESCGA